MGSFWRKQSDGNAILLLCHCRNKPKKKKYILCPINCAPCISGGAAEQKKEPDCELLNKRNRLHSVGCVIPLQKYLVLVLQT